MNPAKAKNILSGKVANTAFLNGVDVQGVWVEGAALSYGYFLYAADEKEWAESVGIRIVHIEEFFRLGPEAVAAEARRIVGDGPTYVSFDVDGLDPVYAPGTGTPEIGGFSTAEAQRMIRGLEGLDLVGGDVVEVAPPFDPSGNTALVGATMMFEILCVLAPAVHRRKNRMRRL